MSRYTLHANLSFPVPLSDDNHNDNYYHNYYNNSYHNFNHNTKNNNSPADVLM